MTCTNCGASLESVATFCGYCGSSLAMPATSTAVALAPAGAFAQPVMAMQAAPAAPVQPVVVFSDLPPYYLDAFARIEAGGIGASKWNWTAFLFTIFWYFYCGMWGKALLLLGVNIATGGVIGIGFAIYAGKYGNYDYWLLRKQGKQLW